MKSGLVLLCVAYVLSQFYRSFLAVLTPALQADIGAGPEDLAFASGLWFLAFAAMQIPVGEALDRIGPRRTAGVLLLIGGAGGAVMFGMATQPVHIALAMALIGLGCSPVLMASYYIFARIYSPAVFATLAAVLLGTGSLGNLAGSLPMAMAAEALGWRATMLGLGALSAVVALGLLVVVKDPERVAHDQKGSVLDLLKIPAMWLIFPLMFVQYAPAGGLRGVWVGPYMDQVFGLDATAIGKVTLVMGAAMILGTFAYGPLDRLLGTRKWVIAIGNAMAAVVLFMLYLLPLESYWTAALLFAAVGFFGASFPVLMAHGRSFFPPHLVGRGVTLMNLFGIGGVGLFQVATGKLHSALSVDAVSPSDPYRALFLLFAVCLVLGLLPYLLSQDRTD
ncbi:MFS transport protein AraJ [Thalassovita gelatinovora]|uniref:MFS transport protein AraJ n=1 Tax=Thalassovita gelatinovora TaxID=53501 RepID=A0A0P1FB99_THAGE|nr:MFS transporter [Thalassovita gelatinovora]QIZ80735.1 MFS transporter [Thalassovita gelatinovora]CUH65357.1 MFS transport protein AraJ [Thalassovita gelatinovora]SEQ89876.1 Sugar phosphate permease [Thalassovita gelatinovora]